MAQPASVSQGGWPPSQSMILSISLGGMAADLTYIRANGNLHLHLKGHGHIFTHLEKDPPIHFKQSVIHLFVI